MLNLKKCLKGLSLILALTLSHLSLALEFKESEALASLFHEHQGVMVVKKLSQEKVLSSDLNKLELCFSPASTFKITHALIALDLGIVKDPQEIFFFYDGHSKYFLKSWEKNMGLKEAVQTSNVEAFKVMAQKIGRHKMQESLKTLDYGNKIMGKKLDEFWLDGSLQISALEQVLFLEKLVSLKLPISKKTQSEVIEILKLESLDDFVLYGKTGLTSGPKAVGWFVGFLKGEKDCYLFALNLEMEEDTPYSLRIELVKQGFKKLAILK